MNSAEAPNRCTKLTLGQRIDECKAAMRRRWDLIVAAQLRDESTEAAQLREKQHRTGAWLVVLLRRRERLLSRMAEADRDLADAVVAGRWPL